MFVSDHICLQLNTNTVFLFESRPLVLSISGLLIWLVQSGFVGIFGAVLGWRLSASLPELADSNLLGLLLILPHAGILELYTD